MPTNSKHWQNAAFIIEGFVEIFEKFDGKVHCLGADQEIIKEVLRAVLLAHSNGCPDSGHRALALIAIVGPLHALKNASIGTLRFYCDSTLAPALTALGFLKDSGELRRLLTGTKIRTSKRTLVVTTMCAIDVLAERFFHAVAESHPDLEPRALEVSRRTFSEGAQLAVKSVIVADYSSHAIVVQMTATEEGLAKKFDDFIVNLEYYTKAEFAGVSGSVASGSTAVAEQVSDMATATSAAECLSYLDPSTWSHAVLTSTPKQLKQLLTVAGVSTSSRRSSRGGRRRGPAGQELLRGRLALHEAGAGKDVCVTVTKKDLDAGIVCGLPPPERLRANLSLVVSIPQRCHALLTSSRLHRRPHASSGALHGAACRRCFSCARVCFHLQSPFVQHALRGQRNAGTCSFRCSL